MSRVLWWSAEAWWRMLSTGLTLIRSIVLHFGVDKCKLVALNLSMKRQRWVECRHHRALVHHLPFFTLKLPCQLWNCLKNRAAPCLIFPCQAATFLKTDALFTTALEEKGRRWEERYFLMECKRWSRVHVYTELFYLGNKGRAPRRAFRIDVSFLSFMC